jgi:hypothetical protein
MSDLAISLFDRDRPFFRGIGRIFWGFFSWVELPVLAYKCVATIAVAIILVALFRFLAIFARRL